MGLDISKITNENLKLLANMHDKDNNAKLEGEEYELFKTAAYNEVKAGNAAASDVNEILGLYSTNTIAATKTTADVTPLSKKGSEKWNKEMNEGSIAELKGYAGTGKTRDDFVKDYEAKEKHDEAFLQVVKEVQALMPTSYTSSKEVDKKHKEIEKKLGKDDFKKEILEQLETMAKNECKLSVMGDIADEYKARRDEYAKAGLKRSSAQLMDKIKSDAKKADKYKGDYKEAFKEFNQPMMEAYDKVYAAIDKAAKELNTEKGKKIVDKAEEILKADGQWDKHTKKALLGDRNIFKRMRDWATAHRSDGEVAAHNKARETKVEHKKVQSQAQILDALGKRTHLLKSLIDAGFVEDLGNGQYDLSDLSKVIGIQVGTDYKLNRDEAKDKNTAEKLMTTAKMKAISDLYNELDDKDAKALVKLCGYEVEKKNIGKAIFSTILGAAGGAAATTGSVYAASTQLKDLTYNQAVPEQILDLGLKDQINAGLLPKGVHVDAEGFVHISTEVLAHVEKLAGQLSTLGLYAALPGALIGGALGLASGLKDRGQIPEIPSNFSEENLKEYVETLEQAGTPYADVAIYMAKSFVGPDGKWDIEGYKKFLSDIGGSGNDIINREELIGGIQKRKAELENNKNNNNVNNNENNNGNVNNDGENTNTVCNVDVEKKPGEEKVTTEDKTLIHHRTKNVGWKEIVNAYYPTLAKDCCNGQLYGPNGAIRALQKALCTDENGNLDNAKLSNMIHEKDVPLEIKLPLKVMDCERKDDAKAVAGNYRKGSGASNKNKVGRDQIVTTKQVGPGVHVATDGCNGHTASGSNAREAVENLEKQEKKQYGNRDQYIK